jgi:D-lactate dehydrogenase
MFPDIESATASLSLLIDAGFAAIELLDAAALRVAQREPDAPADLVALSVSNHAALLVELQESSAKELEERLGDASAVLGTLPLHYEPGLDASAAGSILTTDPDARAALWHIRKGLYAAVAGNRPSGTTALLEDIAVPVERLGDTCTRLIDLFDAFGYEDSVIFGHAKDGNIHFLINERFDDPDSVERYEAFTLQMVELVLDQGGTLKAEHGTGRIMAPFVRRQYGDELYDVMWEVKRLIDPGMVLNPGVLLTDDPHAHLANLKMPTTVESEVDRCVECGYCEPACPSRDLTLTPRERIVLRRELQQARSRGDERLAGLIEADYEYDGVQTCAVDGMCQTACPVLINTGDLVRRLRAERRGPVDQAAWTAAAKGWGPVSRLGGAALSVAKGVPAALPALVTRGARAVFGDDDIPAYSPDLPGGGTSRPRIQRPDAEAVYFASCTTTMFGPVGGDGVTESFIRLCERAGVPIATPPGLGSLCCGTPWKSKGYTGGYDAMKAKVTDSLRRATRHGELPVVCDASSCTEGLDVLLAAAGEQGIRVIDAVAFADEYLLPRLTTRERIGSLTLHPTCSSTRLGANAALLRVARATSDQVTIPDDWSCCAFAGDRGMLHPELTASATAAEAKEVALIDSDAHASLNRTCELGMTRATGHEYQHILQLLDVATRLS